MNKRRSDFIEEYVGASIDALRAMPRDPLVRAIDILQAANERGARVLIAGNGGSASTANHMATDLFNVSRRVVNGGFRPIALQQNPALVTATANDHGFDDIFAAQVRILAESTDVLVVITGSGESPNIVKALEVGKQMGLATIGLLGMGGGKAATLVDVPVVAPSDDYGIIEDIHLTVNHLVAAFLRSG